MSSTENQTPKSGKVFLVGAGPGDPDLITVKGLHLLKRADAVVYDYLVSPELLAETRLQAEKIYVGKKAGEHSRSQEQINTLLVELARQGKEVVRLKGGDPFVFGRGGEEAEVLRLAGIPFEIVPGVSSVVGVPAYAGIPLTHRELSSSFTVVTGHEDQKRPNGDSRIYWEKLANIGGTLVFLMGVSRLDGISSQLIQAGLIPTTPAAVIQWGTTLNQRTITAPLKAIAEKARQEKIASPAILVVGAVVGLRESLRWFEPDQPDSPAVSETDLTEEDEAGLTEAERLARQQARHAERRKRAKTAIKKGLVLVNTGKGKGKTTAALGLAVRAWGQGQKVCVLQFIKAKTANWGEEKAFRKMGIEIFPLGDGFTWLSENIENDKKLAREGWELCKAKILSGEYDLVVLDEMTYTFKYKWLEWEEVKAVLDNRPPGMHLVFTGRNAPPELLEYADMVSEINEVKHHYKAGVRAQKGIEF